MTDVYMSIGQLKPCNRLPKSGACERKKVNGGCPVPTGSPVGCCHSKRVLFAQQNWSALWSGQRVVEIHLVA